MKKNLKIIFKFLWNILKHILLLPTYCSLPDKYNGTTYGETSYELWCEIGRVESNREKLLELAESNEINKTGIYIFIL